MTRKDVYPLGRKHILHNSTTAVLHTPPSIKFVPNVGHEKGTCMQASGHCSMSWRCRVQASGHCLRSSHVWKGQWPRDEWTLVWTPLKFHLLGHQSRLRCVHWLTLPVLTSGSPTPWKPSVEVVQVHDAGHRTSRIHQESAADTP